MIHAENTARERTLRRKVGLSAPVIVFLAALAAIRVPFHDLGIVPEGGFVNSLLVFAPPALWIVVVLWRRVPNPFLTLVAVGFAYGVMLAVGHQIFWAAAYDGSPPSLGGNLDGVLGPALESVVFRAFAFVSGIFTGTLVGAVAGTAAWVIGRVKPGQGGVEK